MKEQSLWNSLRNDQNDRPRVVMWKRHQSPYGAGRPDVSFRVAAAAGQLELKTVDEYPARESTRVWVAVTPLQRRTLREWAGFHGLGMAYVLLAVERDWYLLDPASLSGNGVEYNAQDHPGLLVEQLEDRAIAQGTTSDWVPLYQGLWGEFVSRVKRGLTVDL